MTSPETQNKN